MNRFRNIVLFIFAYFSLAICFILVPWYFQFGFDMTDEAYYFLLMENFNRYLTISKALYLLHPVWLLFEGSPFALRLINFLIIYSLTWYLFRLILSDLYNKTSNDFVERQKYNLLTCILSSTSIFFISGSLVTPSYNQVNFISTLIILIGLLKLRENKNEVNLYRTYTIIAFGGWLSFMAKPSTTMLLMAVVFINFMLIEDRIFKKKMSGLFITGLLSLTFLFFSSFFLSDGVIDFVNRYFLTLDNFSKLGSNHLKTSLLWRGWENGAGGEMSLDRISTLALQLTLLLPLFIFYLCLKRDNLKTTKGKWWLFFLEALYVLAIFALLMNYFFQYKKMPFYRYGMHREAIFILVASFCFYFFLISMWFLRKVEIKEKIGFIILSLSMAFAGYANVFGTNRSYGYDLSYSLPLMMAGVLYLVLKLRNINHQKMVYLLSVLSLATVVSVFDLTLKVPYRQTLINSLHDYFDPGGRIFRKTKIVKLKNIYLHNEYATYLEDFYNKAYKAGFKARTPVIDMTGAGSGSVYIIDGIPLGSAWLLGAYPGSNGYAMNLLKQEKPEDIDKAWILLEPNFYRKLSDNVLLSVGKNIYKDYLLVAKVNLPKGFGGRFQPTIQYLLKPKSS